MSEFKIRFNGLESTKIGRTGERAYRDYMRLIIERKIIKDIDEEYDTRQDLIINDGTKDILVEVKVDNCKYETGNLPFEFKQTNIKGELVDSGILVTKADVLAIICIRRDTLYIIDMNAIRFYLKNNTFRSSDIRECNLDSETGKTLCYVMSIGDLSYDGAILEEHNNFLATLSQQGFNYTF